MKEHEDTDSKRAQHEGWARVESAFAFFDATEVLVESRAKLLGNAVTAHARGLAHRALVDARLLIPTTPHECNGSVIGLAAATSARRGAATSTTAVRVLAFGLEEELDRFRLGSDRIGTRIRLGEQVGRFIHDLLDLLQDPDLPREVFLAVLEFTNELGHFIRTVREF